MHTCQLSLMTRLFKLLLLLLICTQFSCKKDDTSPVSGPGRTVLVYLGGDNNLSAETNEKLEALRKGWKNENGRLIVYQDSYNGTPRLMEIVREASGQNTARSVKTYPVHNSADPAVFKQVLHDAVSMYPADSYGLIYFSHASGWLPPGALLSPYAGSLPTYSIGRDGTAEMELNDMAAAIPDHQFDFIIFEACFMSGVEVAYALKDKTDFLLASSAEILSPGFSPFYGDIEPMLFKDTPDLQGIADRFYQYYHGLEGNYRSATISLIRTDVLPELAAWVRSHADFSTGIDAALVQHFDRYNYRLFFDLQDYLERCSEPDSHAALQQILDKIVVYKAATVSFMPDYNGFRISKHSGLTAYIIQPGFDFLNQRYTEQTWYKAVF